MSRTVQANPKVAPKTQAVYVPNVPRELSGVKLYHSLDEDFSVYPTASFIERFFANGIDYFILGIATTLLESPFARIMTEMGASGRSPKTAFLSVLIWLVAMALLQVAPLVFWGQTLGKTFFGIRVVNVDDSATLRPLQVIGREIFGKTISTLMLGIGYLMMLWNPKRQTFHDKISATKVVKFRR